MLTYTSYVNLNKTNTSNVKNELLLTPVKGISGVFSSVFFYQVI